MNILEKIVAKKALKSSLERLSESEKIAWDVIQLKFNFHPEQGLKFFIMNGEDVLREEDIYVILELSKENEMHKGIISRVETKLSSAINKTAQADEVLVTELDARFCLAHDNKKRVVLSMDLFFQNEWASELNIDEYFSK